MSSGRGSLLDGLRWWLGALAESLTPGPAPFARGALRLRPEPDGFAILQPDGSALHRLSLQAPSGNALSAVRRARLRYLDLDDEAVLSVRAILPGAARGQLREAIALRIPELTPFTEDEVVFDIRRPTAVTGDAVAVNALIVPRRMIAEQLAALADLGIRVDGIIASDIGEATGAEVPDFAPEMRVRRGRNAGAALLAACMLLVGGLAWLHSAAVERQEAERRVLEEAITAAISNIREAKALDEEIAGLTSALGSPSARHSRGIAPLDLLDAVAEALPDDAYLTGLRWSEDEIVLTGMAVNASTLIARLEGSPILAEVRFSAPVSRDPRVDRDRFSIRARALPPELAR